MVTLLWVIGVTVFIMFTVLYKQHMADVRKMEEEKKRKEEERKRQREYEELERLAAHAKIMNEVSRQASLVGDEETVEAVKQGTYNGDMPQLVNDYYYTSLYDNLLILPIAGINYREGMKSCVGDFKGVLVPEPSNDYDPNAIKIKREDGKHLGYIPEVETAAVRALVGEDFKRHRITGTIEEREDFEKTFYVGFVSIAKPLNQ